MPLLVVVLLTRFEAQLIFGVPKEVIGAAIFGIAAFTDWLDGYLARRRQQITALGQLMDPLADKLLITAAFISLVQMGLAPAWMVAVILGRELGITVLRSLVHARGVVIPGVAARQGEDGVAGGGDPAADAEQPGVVVPGARPSSRCGWCWRRRCGRRPTTTGATTASWRTPNVASFEQARRRAAQARRAGVG